jgi:16S rRNA (guanine(966)-N(2))-methyltransferase RsmD
MRLSGGAFKGKKVCARGLGKSSDHGVLRATSSKVRESIFNIIGPGIEGAVFADIYAGTGAVGIEAMSRKAQNVYFIESDPLRAMQIEKTLSGCGCRGKADIRRVDAGRFLKDAPGEGLRLDIVFIDPPYGSGELDSILSLLGELDILSDDALVLAEHSKRESLPGSAGCLEKKKEYRYGDTVITSYRKGS